MMVSYLVRRSPEPIDISAEWDSAQWSLAETAELTFVLQQSSEHHPRTRVRMLYDSECLCGLFLVHDRYVRATAVRDQQQVCRDSCVEFFVRPAGAERYFNFEMNCGGTMLLYHIKHCRSGNYDQVPQEELNSIRRFHTMPKVVDPEIEEPQIWRLGFRIPLSCFERYSMQSPQLSGQCWRANFTKCADATSHPHWLSWAPLSKLDFHLPDEFGELRFE